MVTLPTITIHIHGCNLAYLITIHHGSMNLLDNTGPFIAVSYSVLIYMEVWASQVTKKTVKSVCNVLGWRTVIVSHKSLNIITFCTFI